MRVSAYLLILVTLPTATMSWVTSRVTSSDALRSRSAVYESSASVSTTTMNRQRFLQGIFTAALTTTAVITQQPSIARADVYSGTELPQGVAQFNRCIRLKRDLKKVTKRVQENSSEMDSTEWDNVGKFLRQIYSLAGDDMKVVASTIQSADMKQRALQDADKLRQYAQAADVPVSAKDATGFVLVAQKMNDLVQDFFDALVDVPDL
ncbi:hypothetical protein FisN_4Lh299 [Fistulifera solaris]|uniref:Uncharacterized protein n=1 Tax=Fistulifera solaris TaxID=1519565 RepID=A0A1Z5KDA7_FISSO|nr:hypothetical protein FisN_4Lh299 [Fistulifera solaris]|eukprot:GAX24207.1 hypothetical protein FisN_4Lh299 [Fistulifera solaris]